MTGPGRHTGLAGLVCWPAGLSTPLHTLSYDSLSMLLIASPCSGCACALMLLPAIKMHDRCVSRESTARGEEQGWQAAVVLAMHQSVPTSCFAKLLSSSAEGGGGHHAAPCVPDCSRVYRHSPLLHAAATGCTGRALGAACDCLRHLIGVCRHSCIVLCS